MRTFSKNVDMRNRKDMTEFLVKHFRYNTMNSWNQSTSYANNVKVYNLGLTKEQEDKLYAMLETAEFYTYINDMLNEFSIEHNHLWQVGFNGRSSGYLVLYQGFSRLSGYKSFCKECGQRNYKTIEETGNNRCGRCGADARVNYETMPKEVGCYPGRATDMGEDFEDWELYQLRQRVKLVQEFDELCDNILKTVVDLLENFEVEEQIVMKPHTVKVLREVAS